MVVATHNLHVREFNVYTNILWKFNLKLLKSHVCIFCFACCRFSGEGHDIITPEDMLVAINSNGGINSIVASVVSVDQKQEYKEF